jgi:hypothetical protein
MPQDWNYGTDHMGVASRTLGRLREGFERYRLISSLSIPLSQFPSRRAMFRLITCVIRPERLAQRVAKKSTEPFKLYPHSLVACHAMFSRVWK